MTRVALGMHLLNHGEDGDRDPDFTELVMEHDEAVTDLMQWLTDNPTMLIPVELALIIGHYRLKVRQIMEVRSPQPR